MKSKPHCNQLFLTGLQWRNMSGLQMWVKFIDRIVEAAHLDNQATIYGPKGVEEVVRRRLEPMFSKLRKDKFWPHVLFVEVADGQKVKSSQVTVTAHELLKDENFMYEVNCELEEGGETRRANMFIAETSDANQMESIKDKLSEIPCNPDDSNFFVQQANTGGIDNFSSQLPNWHILTPNGTNKRGKVDGWAVKNLVRSACNKISPGFFPLHGRENVLDQNLLVDNNNFFQLSDFTHYLVTGTHGLGTTNIHSAEKYTKVYRGLKEKVEAEDLSADRTESSCDFPKLTVLGSGDGNDSFRGCSAYLLKTTESRSMLIDCGPGTLEGMLNHYGRESFHKVLSTIKVVYITHKHADHVGGLGSLIHHVLKTNEGAEEKILLIGPPWLHSLVPTQVPMEEFNKKFRLLSFAYQPTHDCHRIEAALDVRNFRWVLVEHGCLTKGLVLETNRGNFKFAFSSDTLPMSRQLIKHGMDADLLVHECTFLDPMAAKFRMHSDMQGAVDTANRMRAKNLMLNHLSSQFPMYPMVDRDIDLRGYRGNVVVAMDNLEVGLGEVGRLALLRPRMEKVFGAGIEKFYRRAERRERGKKARSKKLSDTFKFVTGKE